MMAHPLLPESISRKEVKLFLCLFVMWEEVPGSLLSPRVLNPSPLKYFIKLLEKLYIHVIHLKRIYNFWCSMLVLTPFD
jgi:hypothetical protein